MSRITDLDIISKTPMFFIVGRPRTGSTLLRTLFDAHPNVTIPQEWPMLLALHSRFGRVKSWDEPTLEAFYSALFQKFRIPYWEITNWPQFNRSEIREAILACKGEHSFETLFKVIYSQYNSYFSKGERLIFGDKNPVYSNQTGILADIFPDAKFIHLTRDYHDNLVSMLEVDFEIPNPAILTYRWKYSWETIEAVGRKFPGRFLPLRYEDLVADLHGNFRNICDFLEIPFDPSIFTFHMKRAEIEASFPKEVINRYFISLFNPIDSSRVGVFRKKLTPMQVRIADQVAGNTAEKAGYYRVYKRLNPVVFLWSLPAVLYARWLYGVGWLVAFLPYKTMMWLLNKPSVLVRLYSHWFGPRK